MADPAPEERARRILVDAQLHSLIAEEIEMAVAAETERCAQLVENPLCKLLSLAEVAAAIRRAPEPSAEEEEE